MRKQTEIINSQIQKVISKSNFEIQQIRGISKYQEFFGKVSVSLSVNGTNSIKEKFDKSWYQLDESIPKWSYPLIYEMALKESELIEGFNYGRNPEALVAAEHARKTVEFLEQYDKSIKNKM